MWSFFFFVPSETSLLSNSQLKMTVKVYNNKQWTLSNTRLSVVAICYQILRYTLGHFTTLKMLVALILKFWLNWTRIEVVWGKRRFQSAKCSQSAKFDDTQAKQGRDLAVSILVQFGPNFRFRAYFYIKFCRSQAIELK